MIGKVGIFLTECATCGYEGDAREFVTPFESGGCETCSILLSVEIECPKCHTNDGGSR